MTNENAVLINGPMRNLSLDHVDDWDFAETFTPIMVSTSSAITANSGVGLLIPRRATPLTIAVIRFMNSTPSGNVDVGVMRLTGTTYTLVASSGSTAIDAGGNAVNAVTLTTAYVQQPGEQLALWLACDNNTATFGKFTNLTPVSATGMRSMKKSSVFPLASATPFTSGLTASTVNIWLHGSAS